MSLPRTVFISHSTHHLDDRAARVRQRLAEILREAGWNVFLDSEVISPGDKWRPVIIDSLAQSRAAIILFNERAVSLSSWVQAEAQILCFRKSIDKSFPIIPVLFDGKTIQDTCFNAYEPFELNEIQALSDDVRESTDQVAERVAQILPECSSNSLASRWVVRVCDMLGQLDQEVLWRIAATLRLDDDDLARAAFSDRTDRLRFAIAETMHHRDPLECLAAFREMVAQLDHRKAKAISRCLEAKWVPNQSIETLMCVYRDPCVLGLLAINARTADDTKPYLDRSEIEFRDCIRTFTVAGAAGEGPEAAIAQVENTIKNTLFDYGLPVDDDYRELRLIDAVNSEIDDKNAAICVLPVEYAKKDVLSELRRRYPKIVFLVQVGATHDSAAMASPTDPRRLRPDLTPAKVNELRQIKTRLRAELQNAR